VRYTQTQQQDQREHDPDNAYRCKQPQQAKSGWAIGELVGKHASPPTRIGVGQNSVSSAFGLVPSYAPTPNRHKRRHRCAQTLTSDRPAFRIVTRGGSP